MTSPNCLTGTDRVAEAAEQIACPTIINVQGDEPLISPEDVAVVLAAALARPDLVHNAVCPIVTDDDFRNRNVPKVVIRSDCQLLYMSRAAIPGTKDDKFTAALRQVCIYGFSRDHLRLFAKQSTKSPLEALEDIEILRFLEMGVPVQMTHLRESTHAVDVPEDVAKIERILRERQ